MDIVSGAEYLRRMTAVVRSCVHALLMTLVVVACGDDDDGDHDPRSDEGGRDASAGHRRDGSTTRDGGREPADPKVVAEYRELLDDWVMQWDRIADASCACFAMLDIYESVEECVALVSSGPDWAECASEALAERDDDLNRDDARCIIEQLGLRADCVESRECSEITMCEPNIDACPLADSALVNVVLEACPDTGLLSRL